MAVVPDLVSLPEIAVKTGVFIGYLREVLARSSGRIEVHGKSEGDICFCHVVGALAEIAVAITRPSYVSLSPYQSSMRWFALTAEEQLPDFDFLLGGFPVDVHGTPHDLGSHLILQKDDRDDVEHIHASVRPDGRVRFYGSTKGLDLSDDVYRIRAQQRGFVRGPGHQPRAVPWDRLAPVEVHTEDMESRAQALRRELWTLLCWERTQICTRSQVEEFAQVYRPFLRAWQYTLDRARRETEHGGGVTHLAYKFSDGVKYGETR